MDESHFLGVLNPLNLYGICKVWHTGVLKVLVGSENQLRSAMMIEEAGNLKWIFENDAVLTLPEKAQVISIATANPLMMGKLSATEGGPKLSRRCLVGMTYCIPPPPQETPPPEPEPAAPPKVTPIRPTGPSSAFVSRILQAARPPPQPQTKPVELPPQHIVPPRFFFSILGANSFENDHWSTIVGDNVTFELPYVPFVLAKYAPSNSSSILFLLSGSDRKLHTFNQRADNPDVDPVDAARSTTDTETAPESASAALPPLRLPLLEQYPSPVVSIDILDSIDGKLHVVVGCQDGSVVLTSGDSSGAISRELTICLDGPITSVKIYQVARNRTRGSGTFIPTENDQTTKTSQHPSVRRLFKHIGRSSLSTPPFSPSPALDITVSSSQHPRPTTPAGKPTVEKVTENEFAINVVVASAVGFAAVFKNVAENGFGDFQLLPDSDKHDAVLGLAVSDIDNDGHVEILVGTYGQRILAYAETKGKQVARRTAPLSPALASPTRQSLPHIQSSLFEPQPSHPQISENGIPLVNHPKGPPTPAGGPTSSLASVDSPYVPRFPSHVVQLDSSTSPTPSSKVELELKPEMQSSADSSILGTSTSMANNPMNSAQNLKPGAVSIALNAATSSLTNVGLVDSAEAPVSSSSGTRDISTVGRDFAQFFDKKQEEYMRDNVVNSVLPTTTRQRGTSIHAASATANATTQPQQQPQNVFVDFRTAATDTSSTASSSTATPANAAANTSSSIVPPHIGSAKNAVSPRGSLSNIVVPLAANDEETESVFEQVDASSDSLNSFSLLWHRSFTHPVYQIMCDDFVHDGTVAVIASTLYGIHLLRYDFENAASKAQRRLALLSDIIKLERQLYRYERTAIKPNGSSSPISPDRAQHTEVSSV